MRDACKDGRKEVNKTMLELMKQHLAAYAISDWDAYKAYFAPDVEYEEVATGKRVTGIEAYLETIKRWKIAFPDLKATIKRSYEFGDTLIAELEWEGTHRGPLDTPFGIVPATNQHGSLNAVLINTFKDGKVVESRHYFDQMTVLMQVRAAPAAEPPRPAAQPYH